MLAVVVVGYTLAAVAVGVVSWVGARQGTAGPWRAGLWAVWLGACWPGTLIAFGVWWGRRHRRRGRLRVVQSDRR